MTIRSISALLLSVFFLASAVQNASADDNASKEAASPKKAAAADKAKLSDSEPDSLAQLNHESISAFKEHKYDIAEHLMEKVIAGLEKEKVSDLSLSEALENLGLILKEAGKAKESEAALARATQIRVKYHMPPAEAKMVDILPSETYRKQGTDMVKETADIVDGHDPMFPPESLTDKSAPAWTALIAAAQHDKETKGGLNKAFIDLRRALAIANTMPRPNDKVVSSMNMLAGVYRRLGRPYSARMLYLECMAQHEKLGKKDTADYATLLDNAAQTFLVLHETKEAEKMLERAIEIYKKLPNESADLGMTMCTLGEVYLQQKENEKGEKMLVDGLAILKKTATPDDMRVLITQDNLADYYSHNGKLKEAEDLQKNVVASMEKVLAGKPHPDLTLALNNLAQTLYREKKFDEVDPLLKRCVDMNKQMFGDKHPKTLHAMGSYAQFLEKTGKKEEADKILKQITSPQ